MDTQAMVTAPSWTWAIPLIASVVAFTGVTIAVFLQSRNFKKQLTVTSKVKIAEMRADRINKLRDAMVNFHSYGVTPNIDHKNTREFYEYGTRIELLMNSEDKNYKKLNKCQYKFLNAKSKKDKYSANRQYVKVCQAILKADWDALERDVKDVP
jgi:hypothetical protein